MEFLNKFFGNLLLGESNVLDNREMQIKDSVTTQKATQETTQKILKILESNPKATRKELAEKIGLTPDGIKWNLNKLKKEGIIRRIGPDKGGHWEII